MSEASTDIIHYQNRYMQVVSEADQIPYIISLNGSMCVPITDTGMVMFIVEPSPAYGEDVLVLPGGAIDDGESTLDAANRELQEEIGYKAQQLDFLGELRPWVKYLRGAAHIFLARDLIPSKLHGDEIYAITTQLVPLMEFERLIAQGRLHDSTVIAALYMARQFIMTEAMRDI